LRSVTVNKTELLAILETNRAAHRDIFLKALDAYRVRVIEEFEVFLKDAREGRKIKRNISWPEPEDHTRDYDNAIRMLELSVDNEIELDEQDFQHYVMDQWVWRAAFTATNVRYLETE